MYQIRTPSPYGPVSIPAPYRKHLSTTAPLVGTRTRIHLMLGAEAFSRPSSRSVKKQSRREIRANSFSVREHLCPVTHPLFRVNF